MKSAEERARIHRLFGEGWSKRKIAAELGISRNTVDRYLRSQPILSLRSKRRQYELISAADHSVWSIGPYRLTTSGELSLGDSPVGMAEAQRQILLLFVNKGKALVSREEIAQLLWPGQELTAKRLRNVTLSMHRLRDVFAMALLGGT